MENQFHIVIEQLRVGNRYTIEEMPQRGFSVSYSFNDVANVDNVFEMTQGENHLQIINAQSDTTSITIEKYIRSTCVELCRPNRFEEFQVRIIAWNQDRIIRLNERNNFCVTLFDMEPGYYDITEISDNASYEVSYIVNGRKETNYANLELNSCEEASVLILNTDPDNTCNPQQESPLRICKFIRRCDGCITQPDKKDSFKVMSVSYTHLDVYKRQILDGVISMVFASALGIGVIFAALPLLIYQGGITLLASFMAPIFSDALTQNLSYVGSVLIFGGGINLFFGKQIRIGNLLPALLVPILYELMQLIF